MNIQTTGFSLLILAVGLGLVGCERVKQEEDVPATELIEGYQGEMIRSLSEEEFEDFKRIGGRLVVVDFYADWCGPCRQLGPVLEKLTREFEGTVVLGKVNVDQAKGLASKMGVSGIPDVRMYLNGKEVERFKGAPPEGHVKELFAMHAPLNVAPASTDAGAVGDESGSMEPAVQPMTENWLPPGMERK